MVIQFEAYIPFMPRMDESMGGVEAAAGGPELVGGFEFRKVRFCETNVGRRRRAVPSGAAGSAGLSFAASGGGTTFAQALSSTEPINRLTATTPTVRSDGEDTCSGNIKEETRIRRERVPYGYNGENGAIPQGIFEKFSGSDRSPRYFCSQVRPAAGATTIFPRTMFMPQ